MSTLIERETSAGSEGARRATGDPAGRDAAGVPATTRMSAPRGVPQVWAGPREAVVGRWWSLCSRFGGWIRKIHSFSGLVDIFEFRGQEVGTLSLPVAFAFDLDLVGLEVWGVVCVVGRSSSGWFSRVGFDELAFVVDAYERFIASYRDLAFPRRPWEPSTGP